MLLEFVLRLMLVRERLVVGETLLLLLLDPLFRVVVVDLLTPVVLLLVWVVVLPVDVVYLPVDVPLVPRPPPTVPRPFEAYVFLCVG